MEVNLDQTIPEEGVLEDMEDQEEVIAGAEVEIQEMIKVEEKDMVIKIEKIATADVADGKNCKT